MQLILGSASPRRLELLAQIGVIPDEVRPPEVDETPLKGEVPRVYCSRITLSKVLATEVAPGQLALCADTTVALGRRIFGKPSDLDEARDMLLRLSGRRHRVVTAVAVRTGQHVRQKEVVTVVRMKRLSTIELDSYLATGDWRGKAGAYAIQGPAAAFIPWIQGSFSAVMGLPLAETAALLQAAGYPLYRPRP